MTRFSCKPHSINILKMNPFGSGPLLAVEDHDGTYEQNEVNDTGSIDINKQQFLLGDWATHDRKNSRMHDAPESRFLPTHVSQSSTDSFSHHLSDQITQGLDNPAMITASNQEHRSKVIITG